MTITSAQSAAIMEIINSILLMTVTKGKRLLAAMFLELVDRADWPEYYELIPEPRCLNAIKSGVEKGRYKDAVDVYTDLSLVFWNALFYNEPASQIALDAKTLKTLLETEWQKKSNILPPTRTSPPPSSAQKVHKTVEEEESSVASTSSPLSTLPPLPTPAPVPPVCVVTPAVRHTPTPAASTSTSHHIKPVPIRPRSRLSPEMDVDILSDDGQNANVPVAIHRDQESEEIVEQLEKGLPRWPGLGEEGWSEDASQERLVEVLLAIKSYKDVIGNRPATVLEAVPEESTVPYLSYTSPLSLKAIENRLRAKNYQSSKEFDQEMARLFEKARRWYRANLESYGRTLLLQRLYQALLSSDPPHGPPYHSTTNFAASRAGPGNVKPVHGGDAPGVAGVTTHRVLSKDRTFVDEVHYKGWSVKLGDWVHLSNPDDPSRPIVAQVFRCWIGDDLSSKKGQPGLTVSWYYRPEQTFHPSNRMFWEGEVFKTSHFADHPLEDIIEKIACQFTARHIRGRPRPPSWYLGFPLYVCDSRYNDRDRVFVKIKNWNSCVPEEVRKSTDFMPIYPFERSILPSQFPSPFIGRGVKGPGGLVAADAAERAATDNQAETSTNGRNLRTRKPAGDDQGGGARGYANAVQSILPSAHLQVAQTPRPPGPDRSVLTAAGALAVGAHTEKLPAETSAYCFQFMVRRKWGALLMRLTPSTAKYFDRDPATNEVLWFPAPPVDIARPTKPKYSMAYLHFLAMKRKRDAGPDSDDGDMASSNTKRGRLDVPPTVTETLASALRAVNRT
ncbi:hypothetical protein DXG01_009125 [Tephrocybe rancida]|nr:hypothetical protein DXG01_009125 [Tephrocybe rancida]